MAQLPNIVILGDYERALRRFSSWDKLEQQANLKIHHEPLHDESLYEAIKDADAIAMVRDRAPLNEAMIARLPKLKFLMFTGERNGTLATSALTSRNIPIGCTLGGPSKETTAELTWALILGASKRLVEENKLIASGGWRDELSLVPMLAGQRLGVMGLGSIGSRVARVGHALGMEVVTWSPHMTPERAAAENAKSISLTELLSTSKVVTMHLVAGSGTKGIISADQLALMRSDSILVNTSRAALINMPDLCKALKAGHPGQAALDVFDIEPLPIGDPLRNTPNLLVTPHLGFIAEPIFETFSKGITETLEAWLEGKPVPLPFKAQ
ncbi:D-2-hydroxyacid dehydrogenase family protein [Polynucleobacter sp. Latsch14-2]|jgi:phosphoglycerate dehydrogenase-like enzyme|uniref:D-2-hydroxyacid dehydrogenase family protein n=1 Tax=Polynucleobacter sp. Latsch14-2 TaxID=2576920 RepID=UPI001C0E599D|nr:D-2-hydroxyacid dehydrogenase family protein [Polynucleobacter sp. Latsch14-2]MBU3614105.1 D-2-hydroxyacid dehydrogenase family protein [Polynucleobacter sp. Latsch14-2]